MRHWIHLGTQKAGSSFLRSLLAQVPQISLPERKELNFFVDSQDQDYENYLACFPRQGSVLFENSPVYFREGAKCAGALARTLGDKGPLLSLFLRDPVEAIISHHDMRLRQGFFRDRNDYKDDPRDLLAFVRMNPRYVDDWRYMHLLEAHWLERFPVPTFAILTFEEFISHPVKIVRELASQAGLDDIGELQAEKVWKNERPSSALAHRLLLLSRSPGIRAVRRRAMGIPALRRLAEQLLFGQSKSCNGDDRMREVKAELAEVLRPDVARLCEFLGRDSLPWSNFFAQPQTRQRTETGARDTE